MKYVYQDRILQMVQSPDFSSCFVAPAEGPMEFYLDISSPPCRADFCYSIVPQGRLFIEDDDGARAVNNLVKYWEWCVKHDKERPVHLIHIVEKSSPGQLVHCRFLAKRMEDDLRPNFHYHLIEIKNWSVPYDTWLPAVREVLQQIAEQ